MLQWSRSLRIPPLLLLSPPLLWSFSSASGPTSIFINQVPEYALLSLCAENQVSTIVRDMEYGCGDGSQMTSYACFCLQSSVKYSSLISKYVSSDCHNNTAQISTALDVFSSYCQLGKIQAVPTGSTTTSSSSSSTAVPASVPASLTPTSTPTSSLRTFSSNHTVAIAVGVSVPVGIIALGLAGALLWWRHHVAKKRRQGVEVGTEQQRVELNSQREVKELNHEYELPPPQELDSAVVRPELETPTNEKVDNERE